MRRWSILMIVQRDATQTNLFIILQVHSTCSGCQTHPLSAVHKTVTTASGTGCIFLCSYLPQTWPSQQSISYSASSLYKFRVSTTPIIRSTQNCNYSLRYSAAASLQHGPTLEGGSCTKNMTSTGSCSYSFVYSWWWMWLTPETCRVNLQNNK